MLQDLLGYVQDPIVTEGLAQVGAATVLAALVVLLSWRRGLELEAELSVAFVRGFVQVVAVGLVIGVLLTVPVAWSAVILLGMVGGATWISRQRGEGLPGVTQVSFLAITVGAGHRADGAQPRARRQPRHRQRDENQQPGARPAQG